MKYAEITGEGYGENKGMYILEPVLDASDGSIAALRSGVDSEAGFSWVWASDFTEHYADELAIDRTRVLNKGSEAYEHLLSAQLTPQKEAQMYKVTTEVYVTAEDLVVFLGEVVKRQTTTASTVITAM